MAELEALTQAIEAGNRTVAAELTQRAIDAGVNPREILASMTAAMAMVGGRFQRGEIYVPRCSSRSAR
jgi:methanogenic corrinoid protein MtbC1